MRIQRLLALSAMLSLGLWAQAPPGAPPSSTLKIGDKAPDFTLPSTDSKEPVHLANLVGKGTIVLAFFPAAFTGG